MIPKNNPQTCRSKYYRKKNLEITDTYYQGKLFSRTTLYPNGKKVCESYSKQVLLEKYVERNYQKNGPYESYFPNGTLREKGTYKKGEKEGIFTTYVLGQIQSKFVYKNGVIQNCTDFEDRHPVCKYFYKDGQPYKRQYLDKNFEVQNKKRLFKNGPYQLKQEDGSVWEEGICKNGFLFPTKRYHKNGKVSDQFIRQKNGNVIEESYDEQGQVEFKWIHGDQYKIVSEEYYSGKKLSSKSYKEGDVKIDENYIDGELACKNILYPDGTKIYESYCHGKLFMRNTEKNYKRHGLCQTYSTTDGTLESEAFYSKGELISKICY